MEQNTGAGGQPQIGAFQVVIDDGTGYPSNDLLSSVASAVDAVRPIGTTFAVIAPQVLKVEVLLSATFATAQSATSGIAAIQNQIAVYLNGLPIGAPASVTRIAQNAYLATSLVQNVSGIQLNTGPADIVPPALTVIKAGQITVSVNDG